jgi:hypothetical protein
VQIQQQITFLYYFGPRADGVWGGQWLKLDGKLQFNQRYNTHDLGCSSR